MPSDLRGGPSSVGGPPLDGVSGRVAQAFRETLVRLAIRLPHPGDPVAV
jgi:hypothetical protein